MSYASWLTIDNTSFSGVSGTITYSVQPNPLASQRSGVIQVGALRLAQLCARIEEQVAVLRKL